MLNKPLNPQSCQTDVSGSAFSTQDLKCGNLLNYDTAEGEILPTIIDWQDLKWITEDPKGFNLVHSPIELTRDIICKIGFIIIKSDRSDHFRWKFKNIEGHSYKNKGIYIKGFNGKMDYLHDFQNYYYSLNGVMLSLS